MARWDVGPTPGPPTHPPEHHDGMRVFAITASEGEAARSDQGRASEQLRALHIQSAEPSAVLRRLQAVR